MVFSGHHFGTTYYETFQTHFFNFFFNFSNFFSTFLETILGRSNTYYNIFLHVLKHISLKPKLIFSLFNIFQLSSNDNVLQYTESLTLDLFLKDMEKTIAAEKIRAL